MNKKKVISFFVIFAMLAALLVVTRFIYFGDITGFAVYGGNLNQESDEVSGTIDKSLIFRILDYEVKDSSIKVFYYLADMSGEGQIVNLRYKMLKDDMVLDSGAQEVFVSPGAKKEFIMQIRLPSTYIDNTDLEMEFSNKMGSGKITLDNIVILKNNISGFAILERGKSAFSLLAVVLIGIMMFFILSAKFYHKKHQLRKLRRNFNSEFIKLNLG